MAVKTYRATAKGYVDGRVIAEGEVFTTEFKELVRNEKGEIERDKEGVAKTKAGKVPSWAEAADASEVMAQEAAQDFGAGDPNFEAMDKAALQAYAAERNIQFEKTTPVKDLIAAIKAAADPTR